MRTVIAAMMIAISMAAGAAEPLLGGRPFSPPGEVLPMPEEWTARSVHRPEKVDLALAIDQQLYPAILPLVQRYAREKGLKVALQEGTCGVAAGALADKSADVTGMCCPPGPLDRMPGVRYHTVGISSIALIAHPSNPVAGVTLAEARALFGGRHRSWGDLPVSGVKAAPAEDVRAITRLHCKPRPGHWRLLLDNENQFGPDIRDVPAIRDMISEVARTPSAVGYETLWHVADNARVGTVKLLRLDGVHPADTAAVAKGRYPLYRVMNLTTWTGAASNPAADRLVEWLVASAGEIDPAFGIVPASALHANGWRFSGAELVGEPGR
ncbi:MAG: substrate-binding domain-containing protein [Pseudomonadota bacterium]